MSISYSAQLLSIAQKVSVTLAISPSVYVTETDQVLLGPGEIELTGLPGQSFDVVADIRHNALTAPAPVYIGIASGDEMAPKSNVRRMYIGRYRLPTINAMAPQAPPMPSLHGCAQGMPGVSAPIPRWDGGIR